MRKPPIQFILSFLAILIAIVWVVVPNRNLEPLIVLVISVVALTPFYRSEFLPWIDNLKLQSGKFKYLESKSKLNAIEGDFDEFSNGINLVLRKQRFTNYPIEAAVFFEQIDMQLLVRFPEGEKLYLRKGIEVGYEPDQEVSMPKLSNRYFLAQFDIDNDGVDELLFGVIDAEDFQNTVQISVLKYHPPLYSVDIARAGNWQSFGKLVAYGVHQSVKVKLAPGTITIARNFRDLEYKWSFIDKKAVYIGSA